MIYCIVNRVSGRGAALKVLPNVEAALRKNNRPYTICYTDYRGHATILARQAARQGDCRSVLVIGGDGTISEAASALVGTHIPMGIIPAGTGNDLIKTLHIPSKPMDALSHFLSHEPRAVDVVKINDFCFVNECGTGIDVTVLDWAEKAKRYCSGLLPYLAGVFCAIVNYKPLTCRIRFDEGEWQEHRVTLCACANGGVIGGGIPIAPSAVVNDGLLDVILADNLSKRRILQVLPGLLKGKIMAYPECVHVRCKEMEIRGQGMRLNVDGEIVTMDEAKISIVPAGIRIYW